MKLPIARVLILTALAASATSPTYAADKPLTRAQQQALAKEVTAIFTAKCAQCHDAATARKAGASKEQSRAVKKIDYILDLSRVGKSLVKGTNPNDSDLWYEVNEEHMPPKDSEIGALSKAQKAVIEKWIKAEAPAGK